MIGEIYILKNKRGQSLVEVVISLGIISVVLTSLMSLVIASRNLLYQSEKYTNATSLAREGLEIAKHQRDIGCAFSTIKGSVAGGTSSFVIKGDTEIETGGALPDETLQPGNWTNATQIGGGFENYRRHFEIWDLSNVNPNAPTPGQSYINDSGFQTGSCSLGSSANYDCTNRYYFIRVIITDKTGQEISRTETIMSKE